MQSAILKYLIWSTENVVEKKTFDKHALTL